MKKIETQTDIDDLLSIFDWNDAFIREFYAISPEYVIDLSEDRASYGAAPSMYMLLCSSEAACPSIEILFCELIEFNIRFRSEFSPQIVKNHSEIEFFLFGQNSQPIRAKALYYKMLDRDSWGFKLRYGYNIFFDESGLLHLKSYCENMSE